MIINKNDEVRKLAEYLKVLRDDAVIIISDEYGKELMKDKVSSISEDFRSRDVIGYCWDSCDGWRVLKFTVSTEKKPSKNKYLLIDVRERVINAFPYTNLSEAKEDLYAEYIEICEENHLEEGDECEISEDGMTAYVTTNSCNYDWKIVPIEEGFYE